MFNSSFQILILSFPPIMFAFIAANFNAKLKLVRSRTQDPMGMSSAGGTSSRNGSIKDRVRRTVLIGLDGQRKAELSGQP